MECHDAATLFEPKRRSRASERAMPCSPREIGVLTRDRELLLAIKEALSEGHFNIEPLRTIDHALHRVRTRHSGVTILHLHRSDIWPGIAFRLFDGYTQGRPIIILCDSCDEARSYRKRAEGVVDVLPVQAVRDNRFPSVIDAVMLRAESLASDHFAEKPPSAA